MTILNKSVTFQGALTTLTSYTVYMVPGGYSITAVGVASDGGGNTEQITTTQFFPTGTAVLDNLAATALQKLRQANGLET